jgi:hypothetical protein
VSIIPLDLVALAGPLTYCFGGLVQDLLTYSRNINIVDQVKLLTFDAAVETDKNGGETW